MFNYKTKLKRLYIRLHLMPRKNTFFQKYVRHQIIDLLSWFMYPEFRDKNRLLDLISRNKFMVFVLTFFLLWTGGTFKLGKWSGLRQNEEQIDYLEYRLDEKNDILYNTNMLLNEKDSIIKSYQKKRNSKKVITKERKTVVPLRIGKTEKTPLLLKKEQKPNPVDLLFYELKDENNIFHFHSQLTNDTLSETIKALSYREGLEMVIKRDCFLRHGENLSKLSDKVFFCMIDEIQKYQIPYTLFFRVIDHESGFRFIPNAGGSGAFGYCQVMPTTFSNLSKKLGLVKHDEINNIKVGAYLLRSNFDTFRRKGFNEKDAWYKALVAYSGGNTSLAKSEIKYFK